MRTSETIRDSIMKVAVRFPVKKISYFGSYADGSPTESSDLDVLVEFTTPAISLLILADLKCSLEDELNMPVDVIHAPVSQNSLLNISKMVTVYEQ